MLGGYVCNFTDRTFRDPRAPKAKNRRIFGYNPEMARCTVSFTDTNGIPHSVEVEADSLYECRAALNERTPPRAPDYGAGFREVDREFELQLFGPARKVILHEAQFAGRQLPRSRERSQLLGGMLPCRREEPTPSVTEYKLPNSRHDHQTNRVVEGEQTWLLETAGE
jgi:hypothetical protein